MMTLAPYLAALALVFILFDGGMQMNIYQAVAESPRATVLAVSGFSASMITVVLFMFFVSGVPFLYALLFGSIYGGSSSIVVVTLARKVKMSEKCSTVLTLESAITDILCIVVSLAIIEIILTGNVSYETVAKVIMSRFSVGAVIGILVGVFWLTMLRKANRAPYAYILTLAVVLLTYSFSEYLGGSGPLSSLLIGMVLGNERDIRQMLRLKRPEDASVDEGLKRFESEVAFLMRSFFFVYLGLIATFGNVQTIVVGVILSVLLLIVRYGAVLFSTIRSELKQEIPLMWVTLTRGLAAAVLATLPMQYASVDQIFSKLSSTYIDLAMIIVICTAVITTIGVFVFQRKKS
jgi:cell volume regulation protein A